jgi:hypothetical protein
LIKHLPSKHESLSSNHTITPPKNFSCYYYDIWISFLRLLVTNHMNYVAYNSSGLSVFWGQKSQIKESAGPLLCQGSRGELALSLLVSGGSKEFTGFWLTLS